MVRVVLYLAAGLLLFASVWAGIDHFFGHEGHDRRFYRYLSAHHRSIAEIESKHGVDITFVRYGPEEWVFSWKVPCQLTGGSPQARDRAAEELRALDSSVKILAPF